VVRIVFTTALFAIFSFFSTLFYSAAGYLRPIPRLYEGFALVAVFLLLVGLVGPEEETNHPTTPTHALGPSKKRKASARPSRRWFIIIWILVFQVLPGRVITTIAAEVFEARQSHSSQRSRITQMVFIVIQAVQTILCSVAILVFRFRFKSDLRPHDGGIKLVTFKLIIFLQLTQNLIFTFLALEGELHATTYISYDDLSIGLPSCLTCIEALICSVVLLWPFSVKPFRLGHHGASCRKLGLGAAVLDTINIWDIIKGSWYRIGSMGTDIICQNVEVDRNKVESERDTQPGHQDGCIANSIYDFGYRVMPEITLRLFG
jgi:hypothetical protein